MLSLRELLSHNQLEPMVRRMLLAEITGFSPAQLLSRDDYRLTTTQYQRYQAWLARAASGEPLAYILGYKEFYSRRFKVTPATLIPRPETELLVEETLKRAVLGAQIVDLGSGSGCIAITLKLERPDLVITAVDKFTDALQVAVANSRALGSCIEFIASDWYSQLGAAKFDIIVSNPPYIERHDPHLANLSYEPLTALTDFKDGLECLRQIIAGSCAHLNPGGYLLVEHGFDQGMAVRELFALSAWLNIVTIRDYAGHERITVAHQHQRPARAGSPRGPEL